MKVCGLDIHKDSIFCAIYNGKGNADVLEFATTAPEIKRMGKHLKAEGVARIAMESTGIYWIPVWNILESMSFELHLVNPYLIKQMPGRKSDVKDAQWIAMLLHKGLIRSSMVPDPAIRELRSYGRRYRKLMQQRTSVLQSLERTLEQASIRITSLVSDTSTKSVRRIIRSLIAGETSGEALLAHVHGRTLKRHGRERVVAALSGFVCEHHRFALEQLMEELELYERQAEACLEHMRHICRERYSRELELLMSITGICEVSALIIVAETGADMAAFESSGRFTGWVGLRPRNDESAGKYKSTAITKGNKYLRTILVQVAWAAARTKGSPLSEKFIQLSRRKPRKKALIAIARKMATVIWHVLSEQKPFDPGRLKVYDPENLLARLEYYKREQRRLELLLG